MHGFSLPVFLTEMANLYAKELLNGLRQFAQQTYF